MTTTTSLDAGLRPSPSSAASRPRGPWLLGAVFGGVALLFLAAAVGVVGRSFFAWLSTWASSGVFALAAVVCFWQSRGERGSSAWFAVACACWAGANLYYALSVAPATLPLPSPADVGYFSFPLVLGVVLVARARARVTALPQGVWLDGVVAGLATAAAAAAAVFKVVDVREDGLPAIITSLVYPLEDVALIGVLVAVGSVMGWHLGRGGYLLAAAIGLIAVADVLVFSGVVGGTSLAAWSNVGWTAGIGLITAAAWQDASAPADRPLPPRRPALAMPVVFSIGSLGVLALSNVLALSQFASWLATAALVVSSVRLHNAFSEVRALADSRRLALTDELTRLPNRRQLFTDLARVCDRRTACVLAIFDLDGFKAFNDAFGHPAGDQLLTVLADRLAVATGENGTAYRLGGDEFCVILAAEDEGGDRRDIVGLCAAAMRDEGPGWWVTASFGAVRIPDEARDAKAAMRLADSRMYGQKERRPTAAAQQAKSVLLSALSEQQPGLRAHLGDVTHLAGRVARDLAMSPEEIEDVTRAAELHDVGKLAIPREILDKPGPLDDREWALMRQHTIIGQRMLQAASALGTAALVVRSTHERWDGGGYPDGLRADAIPLGARVVAVCDSFDAMITDRSYRRGMPVEIARAELVRCRGTQFDPRVVDAFLRILARGRSAALPPGTWQRRPE